MPPPPPQVTLGNRRSPNHITEIAGARIETETTLQYCMCREIESHSSPLLRRRRRRGKTSDMCALLHRCRFGKKNLRNVLGGPPPPPPLLPILSPSAVVAQDACPTGASAEGSVVASPPPHRCTLLLGGCPRIEERRKQRRRASLHVPLIKQAPLGPTNRPLFRRGGGGSPPSSSSPSNPTLVVVIDHQIGHGRREGCFV